MISKEISIFLLVNEKATCFLQVNGLHSVETIASADLPASAKASGSWSPEGIFSIYIMLRSRVCEITTIK